MITITNDLHNTRATLRANIGDVITKTQAARARAKLCGRASCLSCGELGQHGPQDGFYLEPTGYRVVRAGR